MCEETKLGGGGLLSLRLGHSRAHAVHPVRPGVTAFCAAGTHFMNYDFRTF